MGAEVLENIGCKTAGGGGGGALLVANSLTEDCCLGNKIKGGQSPWVE